MLGPLLAIFCFLAALAGLAAPAIGLFRLGFTSSKSCWLGLPGSLMVWGLFVTFAGVMERSWPALHPTPLFFNVLGCVGLWLIIRACRGAARPKPLPGTCPHCGYDHRGLSPCPECGK